MKHTSGYGIDKPIPRIQISGIIQVMQNKLTIGVLIGEIHPLSIHLSF